MPGGYRKPCQIFKMMRHIENPSIARTIYPGMSRNIQQYSVMYGYIEGH